MNAPHSRESGDAQSQELGDPILGLAKEVLEHEMDERITTPLDDECPHDETSAVMEEWKRSGHFTVFTAGTFDLLTLNHQLALTQCRLLGARALLGINGELSLKDKQTIHAIAASDRVRLMVTMDTNEQLAKAKSRITGKGGAPKPLLDWQTRAATLTSVSMPVLGGQNTRRNAVDFVTKHGENCCDACNQGECPNEDNAFMAASLRPDMVVVSSGSIDTLTTLGQYKCSGYIPRTDIVIMEEASLQYDDKILGGPISTTGIIRRARS